MARGLDNPQNLTIIVAAKGEPDVFDLIEDLRSQTKKPKLIISCTSKSFKQYENLKSCDTQVVLETYPSIGGAWQSAISLLQTSHCMFLGSSDRLHENTTVEKIIAQIKLFSDQKNFFGAVLQERINGSCYLSRTEFNAKRFFTTGNAICHQGVIFNTTELRKINFDHTRVFCDYEMCYKVFKKFPPMYLNYTISIMRKDGLSTSWPYRLQMRREFNAIIRENGNKPSIRANIDYFISIMLFLLTRMLPNTVSRKAAQLLVGRFS